MAVSFSEYAPFDSGNGADIGEYLWRRSMQHNRMDGVISTAEIPGAPDELQVFADGETMTLTVRPGQCWVGGHWGRLDVARTVTISAADPTNPRKDLVVARADFVADRVQLDVLTGTPAASPVEPPLANSPLKREIALAVVTVPAGATLLENDDIREARLRVGRGRYSHFNPELYYEGTFGSRVQNLVNLGTNNHKICRWTQRDKIVHIHISFGWDVNDEANWFAGAGRIFTVLPPGLVAAPTGDHRITAHLWTHTRDPKGDTSKQFVDRDWLGTALIQPDDNYVFPFFTKDEGNSSASWYQIAPASGAPVPDVNDGTAGNAYPEGGSLNIEGLIEVQ